MLRFGLWYAALLAIAVWVPLFEQLERPVVAGVDAILARDAKPGITRSLALVPRESGWVYTLDLERDGVRRSIERSLHPHGYVLLLFVALVLATPALGWRVRVGALAVGAAIGLPFAAGLLLSDVVAWERAAFPDASAVDAWAVRGFASLHRSAGAALLPPLLWLLYLAWRGEGLASGRPRGTTC
jgi:hypothetical protein